MALVGLSYNTSYAGRTRPLIEIPAIEVSAPIVNVPIRALPQGVTWDTSRLYMTVGYLEKTPWFGDGGNTVLGGHSERARGEADIFWELDQLVSGDEIIVTVDEQERHYLVDRVFTVEHDDLSILRPTPHEQLTLFTCDTESYNTDDGSYNNRIVVVARLADVLDLSQPESTPEAQSE